MNKLFSGIAAAALVSMVGLASVAPASAAPLSGMTVAKNSDVVQVQYNGDAPPPPRHGGRGPGDNGGRHGPGDDRGRHGPGGFRGGHDRPGSWNGFHGYDHRRPGYRRHSDGFWYPLGAFRIQIR